MHGETEGRGALRSSTGCAAARGAACAVRHVARVEAGVVDVYGQRWVATLWDMRMGHGVSPHTRGAVVGAPGCVQGRAAPRGAAWRTLQSERQAAVSAASAEPRGRGRYVMVRRRRTRVVSLGGSAIGATGGGGVGHGGGGSHNTG